MPVGSELVRWLRSAIAGLVAFLGSLVLGIGLTVIAIRSIPPQVPNPTEAYEGFGDYMIAMLWFELGAGVSLAVAVLIGLAVAAWIWAAPNQLIKPEQATDTHDENHAHSA